ncbi:uncharacterized protein LOC124155316 [Ischnura elegans]|uniref:uncharacterized protein LOC124155316 n=1 Tax=Ischnura elegans TaxID=197161 RepID=UPI001ED896FD|nr:uncharacterized protein LOC124155316 [Ischnura elegans]
MDKAWKKKVCISKQDEVKRGRASSRQLDILVEFMAQHREFASGRFLSANGKVANEEMWRRVADILNELPGPSKAGSDWRKCWTDLKCNVRGRASKAKAARGATGNNTTMVDLSQMDVKVLNIIGVETSLGHPVEEYGLPRRPEDVVEYEVVFEADEMLNISAIPAALKPCVTPNPPSLVISPPVCVSPSSSPVDLPSSLVNQPIPLSFYLPHLLMNHPLLSFHPPLHFHLINQLHLPHPWIFPQARENQL